MDGDVPLGSGLSSSAALSCSVVTAVDDLLGLGLSSADQVAVARKAENDFVGAPTGGMDQLASIRGEAGHVLLCDMRSLDTRAVPMDLAGAGLALLVTDTRAPHRNADGEYRERRESCERAAALLGVATLREVQDDDHAAVLDRLRAAAAGDPRRRRRPAGPPRPPHPDRERPRAEGRGPSRRRRRDRDRPPAHRVAPSMRDDFEITVPEVDTAVDAALSAGALGARMTGGGFGGCVIALTPDDRRGGRTAIAARFAAPRFTAPAVLGHAFGRAHRLEC